MMEEEEKLHAGLGILRDAYLANDIRIIEPYLSNSCEYSSFYSTDDAKTKEEVIEVLNERFSRSISTSGKYFRFAMLHMPDWQFGPFQSYYPEFEVLIGFGDEKDPQVMAKIDVDPDGLISKIRILPPYFYQWEVLDEGGQYDYDELYTLALNEASSYMETKGYLELFRERRRFQYPNLVVLDNENPMEIAVIPVRYPFSGSINSSFQDKIAQSMRPDLKQLKVFVKFENCLDTDHPWNLVRGASMKCTVRDEPMDIDYIEMEVNENEFEA